MAEPGPNLELPGTGLRHIYHGKVRDVYELGFYERVFVASDRISAFDVNMNEPIPNKGRILTAMTSFWFDELVDVVPNHEAEFDPSELPEELNASYFLGRTVVAKKANMLPLECIVRGHITGSAWTEYEKLGTINKMAAPKGLARAEKFDEPIFTPSTKATEEHDVNISIDEAIEVIGDKSIVDKLIDKSLTIFDRLYQRAAKNGIIVADAKFEFGIVNGRIVLCDEVGTPDSSRFWRSDQWQPGTTPPSFDKQFLRDYLQELVDEGLWNKEAPPPQLPDEVVNTTARLYQEAYERITGLALADWPGAQI